MNTHETFKAKLLTDPKVKQAYDAMEEEFDDLEKKKRGVIAKSKHGGSRKGSGRKPLPKGNERTIRKYIDLTPAENVGVIAAMNEEGIKSFNEFARKAILKCVICL